jgi:hypothetical protein
LYDDIVMSETHYRVLLLLLPFPENHLEVVVEEK